MGASGVSEPCEAVPVTLLHGLLLRSRFPGLCINPARLPHLQVQARRPARSRTKNAADVLGPRRSTPLALFAAGRAFETCARPSTGSGIDAVLMTVRTDDCDFTSVKHLDTAFLAFMLAGSGVDSVHVLVRTHHIPLAVKASRGGAGSSE